MRINCVSNYRANTPSFGKIQDQRTRKALTKFFLPAHDADECVRTYDLVKGFLFYVSPEDKLLHVKLNNEFFKENPDVSKKPYVDILRDAFSGRYTGKLKQQPKKDSDYFMTKKRQVMNCYGASMTMLEEEFFRENPEIDRYSHKPPPEDLFEKWRVRASMWM